MITGMNVIVQALVWTTLVGLMYAAWLSTGESKGKFNWGLSMQVRHVTNILHTMWVVAAFALTISVCVWFLLSQPQSARAADYNCGTAAVVASYDRLQPTRMNTVCDPPTHLEAQVLPDAFK